MEKEQPLVSVIMPCYNNEQYLSQALHSMMNQSYSNIEILVTDDCSDDSSFEILRNLSKQDKRIKVIRHTTNKKIVETLNELIGLAKGKYIARMDSDDISFSNRIQEQVEYLESHKEISGCGTNAYLINTDGKIIDKTCLPISSNSTRYFLRYYSVFFHPTMMLRSDIFKTNLYNENFLYVEDYELWCRLIFEKGCMLTNLPQYLFQYRISKNQTSRRHETEQLFRASHLFDIYRIVRPEWVETHKKVFFLRDKKCTEKELQYCQYCAEQLKNMDTGFAVPAIEKILYYLLKQKKFWTAMRIALSRQGIYTIFKDKVKGKK